MTSRGRHHMRVVETLALLALLAVACSTADVSEPAVDPLFASGDYAYQCEVTTSAPTDRTFDALSAVAFEGSIEVDANAAILATG